MPELRRHLRAAVSRETRQRLLEDRHVVDVLDDDVAREERDVLGLRDDVPELGRAIPGVQRAEHRTGERDAEDRVDELGPVRHQHADMLPGTDAEPVQPPCQPSCVLRELAVGADRPGEADGGPLRPAICGVQQEAADRRSASVAQAPASGSSSASARYRSVWCTWCPIAASRRSRIRPSSNARTPRMNDAIVFTSPSTVQKRNASSETAVPVSPRIGEELVGGEELRQQRAAPAEERQPA